MTVLATNVTSGPFFPNGSTVDFPFDFEVVDTDEVSAILDGVTLDPALFSVDLNDDGTGEVTFFTAPDGDGATNKLYLTTNPDFSQQTTLANQGPYFQRTIEKVLDRLTIVTLWLRDRILRAPIIPIDATDVIGKYPVVNPDGSFGWSSGTGSDPALRGDLGDDGGAVIVVTSRGNTVEKELTWARAASAVSINEFYDTANGAAAERMALDDALATGRDVQWLGDIVLDQPITMPVGSGLRGFGFSSEDSVNGKSRIVRGFAGADPMIIAQRECRLIDIDVDGQFSGTGDNIQVKGGRCILRCSSRHAGRDGIWFGATDEAINANLCVLEYYLGIDNARYGMRIEHTNTEGAGGSYPLGGSNASAGYAAFVDLRKNGAAGLYTRSAIDWTFAAVRIQENYDEAWVVEEYTRGFEMLTPYIELNNMVNNPNRQVHFRTNSEDNILGANRVLESPKYLDEGSRNYWRRRHPQIDGPAFNRRVNVESDDVAHPPTIDFYAVDLSLAARFGGVSTGTGSQGKAVVWAKPDGNVPIQIMEWVNTVGANLVVGDYYHGGVKVLGARQAAIANAVGGDEVAKINAILAAMRAHGMIAS